MISLAAYTGISMAHSSIPYVKTVFWFLVIGVTLFDVLNKGIDRIALKNLVTIAAWYLLFFIFVYLSNNWAYVDRTSDSTAFYQMGRALAVSLTMCYYVRSEEDIEDLLKSVMVGMIYFSVIFLFTSPVSTWGTTEMGGITGQFRNFTGYACAMFALICLYFYQKYGQRKHIFALAWFAAITLLTGSRGALLSLVVLFCLYSLLSGSITKTLRNIIVIALVLCLGFYFILNNEFFYNILGERLLEMVGILDQDQSTIDRNLYRLVGIEMFIQKPLLGWGYDNFAYYINRFTEYNKEVYSHCNYTEILADYGLVGFVIFYRKYIPTIMAEWKKHSTNAMSKLFFVLMIRYIIFEYSSISYYHYVYIIILSLAFLHTNLLHLKGEETNE